MEDKLKLTDLLERHRGEKHLIVLHEFPDPDAISSAFAHRLLCAEFGIEADIVYTGKLSHQQNVALVKLLGIDLIQYDAKMDLRRYDAAVFVDNQGTTVPEIVDGLAAAKVPVLAVVDHHELQGRLTPELSDIRKIGATATIYTRTLQSGPLKLDRKNKEHVAAATALMHGILTDTHGFMRAGAEDLQAAAFLSEFRDAELLEQIMSQARSKQVMETIRRALGGRVVVESYSIAGIGYLRAEDRDAIPQAADFLLSEENVHTAIVYGIMADDKGEEILVGSMRTLKLTLDPDDFLKEVFGSSETGQYYGGGKSSAGGFHIPVGFLQGGQGEKYQQIKWELFDAQIKYRLFNRIGVERDVLEE